MQTDFQKREIVVKLVYYGPPLSGKTTNLQKLHELLDPRARGRLLVLDTTEDRTLYFDLLPIVFRSQSGMTVKFKVFTVPGQVVHQVTRKLVLQGVDGVAFIADARISETRHNNISYTDLKTNLKEMGIDPGELPIVIQFNKCDLPGTRSKEEIELLARRGREPMYRAVAIQGEGVIETFLGLAQRTWEALDQRMQLEPRFGIAKHAVLGELERQLFSARRAG